jgi:hypothetical protein
MIALSSGSFKVGALSLLEFIIYSFYALFLDYASTPEDMEPCAEDTPPEAPCLLLTYLPLLYYYTLLYEAV